MLLLSKEHDYYDSVGRQAGIDKTIVYKRAHLREIGWSGLILGNSDAHYTENWVLPGRYLSLTARLHLISFCGRQYMFWVGNVSERNKVLWTGRNFHQEILLRQAMSALKLPAPRQRTFRKKLNLSRTWEKLRAFDFEAQHRKARSPVLLFTPVDGWGDREMICYADPLLKDYDFAVHVDPWTAWQEISMYIGGVLGNEQKPMVELTDVDLRNKHGFDKWSFKKLPANCS